MSSVIVVKHGFRRAVIAAGLRGAPGTGGSGSAGVTKFNNRTGAVTLNGADVTTALGYTPANNASLAPVAFSGAYGALTGRPFIPAAPGDIGAASAAQGAKADTAIQPAALAAGLDGKVDKVVGLGLSQESFTTAEKSKLAGLDGPLWKGTFTSLAALQSAHPTAEAGSSAHVDAGVGDPVKVYNWDASDGEWVAGGGDAAPITAAQVRTLYESNPDTNAFTDAEKSKLGGVAAGATANADTDSLPESATPTNKWFTTARVLATVLSGLSLATGSAVVDTDSVLAGFGKLQRQINDLTTALGGKQATLVSGTNIKTVNGESLVGPGNVTVSGGSASSVYATAAIASGSLELDLATAQTFGVMLNANVTTLTLSGAVSGERSSIDVIFSQSMAGGFSVSKPANVRLFDGAPNIASTSARDITYARFTSVDGGENWLLDERKIFLVPPTFTLPTVTTENFINNDEGDSTSGWSATNGTLSTSSSWLRFTKTAGGSSAGSTKTLGTPISTGKDWIEYVSVRSSSGSNNVAIVGLTGSSGSIFSLWLNSSNAATYTAGAVSFQYWNGSSAVASPQVAGASVSSTTPLNLAIQYDNKFGSLTVWVRQSDGRYKFGCRVSCPFFAIQTATLGFTTPAPAGSWVEFDYRSMCNPNFAVIGDSIAEGKNGFSPTVALGLTNDETTWMRHAPLYPALRNNLVVSKGVGANNSAAILARISDVTTLGAKVVFLHCSTNDAVGPVAQATRASNIQGSVDAIVAASAQVVLLNSVYGTESNALNPGARNYYKESWDIYIPAITGVFSRVDTMAPIVSPAGFMLESLTDADKIHLNQAGAAAVGGYIAS